MNVLSYSGKWEDMLDRIIEDLNSCLSLTTLNNAATFYKGLITEISHLRILFDCENGCGVTKISLKLFDGTEFMQILVDDYINTISVDMQREILKLLLELCQKAIECIDKRTPIVEKINKELRKKDTLNFIICMASSVFLLSFYTNIANIIVENVNINGIDLNILQIAISIVLKISGLIFLTKASIIPLQHMFREHY